MKKLILFTAIIAGTSFLMTAAAQTGYGYDRDHGYSYGHSREMVEWRRHHERFDRFYGHDRREETFRDDRRFEGGRDDRDRQEFNRGNGGGYSNPGGHGSTQPNSGYGNGGYNNSQPATGSHNNGQGGSRGHRG